jgi:hypothetical protein
MLGLLLAVSVPSVVLAASGSGTAAGSDRTALVSATTDATPAPAASSQPGEPGTGDTGSGWVRTSPSPAESLAPLALGAVVLVILGVLIAMSFGESSEAKPTGH